MPTHPTAYPPGTTTRTKRSPVQLAALVVGVVFLVVGVLGFVPGITSDYDSLGAAGHESHAMLLGIFQVSVLHNIVHLLFGVAGVAPRPASRHGPQLPPHRRGRLPGALALRPVHR